LNLSVRISVNLVPLSRRRPLPSTEAGVVDSGCLTLTAPQQPPARLTRSSTSSEAEDREVAVGYFFFRRLVFFAVFLAAAFVFDFLFFAMLPS
jgi:hypothetical protein